MHEKMQYVDNIVLRFLAIDSASLLFVDVDATHIKQRCGVGLAWFDCAASEQGASGMGASCDITGGNPAHISPLPAFPTKHKAILTFAI